MGHSENIYKPKILVSSQNHALQVGISKPWVFKSHSVEERLTWRPLISQRFFNAFAHLAECIIMFVVRHVTQDLKFDRPIVHNRYDFDSLGFWIFDIRYLRDYWELWTPVTHALVLLGPKSENILQRGTQHTPRTNYDLDLRSANFREPNIIVYVPNKIIRAPSVLLHQSILAKTRFPTPPSNTLSCFGVWAVIF